MPFPPDLLRYLERGGKVWLFLDYDGTLVPIARTPEEAHPDAVLLNLLERLTQAPTLRTTILSGRHLGSLQKLLPIKGLILAGTYGVEIQWADGTMTRRVEDVQVRPTVERVKQLWTEEILQHKGFLVEDKGQAVALHARFADAEDADAILPRARASAQALLPDGLFRILGGHRFLEIAPAAAHKGKTVEWLLENAPLPGARLVYFGDDDKDEEAFEIILRHGGLPIGVGIPRAPSVAPLRLASPAEVRDWLEQILAATQP
jgi:trehalose 6-phosphate phosphatase